MASCSAVEIGDADCDDLGVTDPDELVTDELLEGDAPEEVDEPSPEAPEHAAQSRTTAAVAATMVRKGRSTVSRLAPTPPDGIPAAPDSPHPAR